MYGEGPFVVVGAVAIKVKAEYDDNAFRLVWANLVLAAVAASYICAFRVCKEHSKSLWAWATSAFDHMAQLAVAAVTTIWDGTWQVCCNRCNKCCSTSV